LSWSKHTGRPPANADILVSLLAELIYTLPIAAKVKWIKAHQDQGVMGKGKLTTSATLNIMADAMASNFLAKCPNTASGGLRQISLHYPTMQASLIIAKSRIHTGTAAKMRQDIKSRRYRAYFIGKYDENREQLVDWDNLSGAYREQVGQTKTTITKCRHGWLSTGARRQVMHQAATAAFTVGSWKQMNTCTPASIQSAITPETYKFHRCQEL